MDDGVSIPHNFELHDLMGRRDCDAILDAINGKSTKDEFGSKGWGLNSNAQLFTENGGEFSITSRNGMVRIKDGYAVKYDLDDLNYLMVLV